MKLNTKKRAKLLFGVLALMILLVPVFGYAAGAGEAMSFEALEDAHEFINDNKGDLVANGEVIEEATAYIQETVPMFSTFWALVPPIVAIILALITKEVYVSLFIGIVAGALFYGNFNPARTIETVFDKGIISSVSDSWNVGILAFLVILGIIVSLVNKAGGSAAYGRWASQKIKSKRGALLSTFGLGCVIFIDDYFNCLTVGSVMRPVTDKFKISRAKLAYIIDATAAPICILAPISSWAAAVTGIVEGYDGFQLFVDAIPYNFYAILTIVMIVTMAIMKFDYGPMRIHEKNAENGDLYTTAARPYASEESKIVEDKKGKVRDLIIPVIVLVVSCIWGMIYTGGFFTSENMELGLFKNIRESFANSDASVGLVYGSFIALVLTFVLYIPRKVITFKQFAESIVEGFRAMVPAILILIFAWTLSGITKLLGADLFVAEIVNGSAEAFKLLLPFIIFLIAIGLAFATGTSWGTFGILLPIVVAVLPVGSEMLIIAISACLAGAVCGDHISPISDTTIMASTGAQSDHINHVSTQLPYALTVAAVSAVCYIIAAIVKNALIALPIAIIMMVAVLIVMKAVLKKKYNE